ncbi:MAG TPA: VCBS repeat-containing protein [Limnochordales bacterium]
MTHGCTPGGSGPGAAAGRGGRARAAGLAAALALAVSAAGALPARPVLARGWERIATQLAPAPSVLELAAADLDGDGTWELALAGRDYERQQDRLYVMGWGGPAASPLRVLAASDPFVEPLSHVALATGPFTREDGPEILVATNSRLMVWRWEGGRLQPAWEGQYSARVAQVAAVHLPGAPAAVAIAHVVTEPRWQHRLHVWQWDGRSLEPVAGPFDIGPVRAMASGDVLGDGQSELVLEVGQGNDPGQVEIWRWLGDSFVAAGSARLRDAPVFGLGAGPVPEVEPGVDLIVAADDRGRVATYRWDGQGFTRVGDVLTLGWGLVASAVGDLDGDGRTEAVVAEYPNLLHVLRWQP